MKKKLFAPLLSILLLSSCNNGIPQDILDYFNSVSFQKAYDNVYNAVLSFTGKHYEADENGDKSDKVLGETSVSYIIDKSDKDDYYTYIDATYSGTFVTSSTDANGETVEDVISKRCVRYKNTEILDNYDTKFVLNDVISTRTIYMDSMLASIRSFFYNEIVESTIYIGGMYYADTMYQIRRYHEFLSVDENNNLRYYIENQFQAGDDGIYNALYTIDAITDFNGMLSKRSSLTKQLKYIEEETYEATSILEEELKIDYNVDNLERILF